MQRLHYRKGYVMSGAVKELRKEAAIVSHGDNIIPRRTVLKQEGDFGGQGHFEVLTIPVNEQQRKFVSDLKRAIVERVAIESLESLNTPTRETIVQAYGLCFARLKRLVVEWSQFVRVLVRIDYVQHGTRMQSVDALMKSKVDKWQEGICSDPDLRAFTLRSIATSEFMSAEVAEILPQLVDDLRDKCEAFAERCIDQLSRLVDLNVCGLVRRFPNHMTEYHYFYRQFDAEVTVATPGYAREIAKLPGVNQPMWRHINSIVVEGETTRTLCRRVHHLMHAIEISPECASIYIPKLQRELYSSCPSWVKPMVRMIEGTMVGCGKNEVDEQSTPFLERKILEEVLSPNYHRDPAFVLGNFVLTGWGPDEIQAEQRTSEPRAAASREFVNQTLFPNFKRYGNQWISLLTAICAVILMISSGDWLIGPVALLGAAVGWSVFWDPFRGHFRLHVDIAVLAALTALLLAEAVFLLDADQTIRAFLCLLLACLIACLTLYRSTLNGKLIR